jgi:hypothetical protein
MARLSSSLARVSGEVALTSKRSSRAHAVTPIHSAGTPTG